jgi:Arc/MetJ-type ribon-helix-helix transcriptional regulator
MAARPRADKPLKEVITVRLDEQLTRDMEALRERDGIPASEQIRRALHMLLESKGIRRKRKSA